jgi:hypothetical protein
MARDSARGLSPTPTYAFLQVSQVSPECLEAKIPVIFSRLRCVVVSWPLEAARRHSSSIVTRIGRN